MTTNNKTTLTTTLPLEILIQLANLHGFVTQDVAEKLAAYPEGRKVEVLLRGGSTRTVVLIPDLPQAIETLEASGDYLRDVCLLAGSDLWKICEPLVGMEDDLAEVMGYQDDAAHIREEWNKACEGEDRTVWPGNDCEG